MSIEKKPIVLAFDGDRVEIKSPKVMVDKSIQFTVNLGEQDPEVLGHIYSLMKSGVKTLVISDQDLDENV